MIKARNRCEITNNVIILAVPLQFAEQNSVLRLYRKVPVKTAPLRYALQRTAESVLSRLALHHPLSAAGSASVVGETEKIEAAGVKLAPLASRTRPGEPYQLRLVRMERKSVTAEPFR